MPKAYCGDCCFISDGEYASYCDAPSNVTAANIWRCKTREYKATPERKNANNDCPEFELVWYKKLFRLLTRRRNVMTITKLALLVAAMEKGKKQVNIAQIKEILACINKILKAHGVNFYQIVRKAV